MYIRSHHYNIDSAAHKLDHVVTKWIERIVITEMDYKLWDNVIHGNYNELLHEARGTHEYLEMGEEPTCGLDS